MCFRKPANNHVNPPSALGLALKHSVSEILVLFVFLMVAVLFFATVVFFAEENYPDSHFQRYNKASIAGIPGPCL